MKIKKKNTTIPISGKIVDTENVEDKISNAPSLRLVGEMVKENYSTEEQVIGTWIDGKPIYRKVITGKVMAVNTTYTIATISNFKEEINKYGNSLSGNKYTTNLNFKYDDRLYSVIQINIENGEILAEFGEPFENQPYKLTIEYTKTTD